MFENSSEHCVRLVCLIIGSACAFYCGIRFGLTNSLDAKLTQGTRCKILPENGILTPSHIEQYALPAADIAHSLYKLNGTVKGGVLNEIFSQLHHPSAPVPTELVASLHHPITKALKDSDPYRECSEVYLTRTGSATSMSNKCIALAYVEDGDTSPYMHGYRMGVSAKLTNRYQGDTVDSISLREEQFFLPMFIKNLDNLAADFQKKMGSPILPSGERKAVTIMVANEGVMDLVLNFLCSCRASGIVTKDSLVVFVGQPELAPVLEAVGVTTFFSEALGPIPKKAATFYGDNVFGVLMWLKTTSLYVASRAGYDVLFQDTDLVWMKDPLPTLRKDKHDIVFMDDGARTPRFTPLYVNSGFYFQKHNERTLFLMEKMMKSISEIAVTHSHQATLTRHITEAHHLVGLQVSVLSQEDFPSGIVFHHDKAYIARMQRHEVAPTVFHMCWTTSREEKVTYFKEIGMWFLPDKTDACENAKGMTSWLQDAKDTHASSGLLEHCCKAGSYWESSVSKP